VNIAGILGSYAKMAEPKDVQDVKRKQRQVILKNKSKIGIRTGCSKKVMLATNNNATSSLQNTYPFFD